MQRLFLVAFCAFFLAVPALAGEGHTRQLAEGAESPPATLDQVAWIAGHWTGEAFGGVAEEVWSAPDGDAMMGMFRLVAGGEAQFYELMLIRQVEDTLLLQLKHFNGDLTGWEEKDETVDFPLVALDADNAWFAGLTYAKTGPDEITVWVMVDEGGGAQEMEFLYRRAE